MTDETCEPCQRGEHTLCPIFTCHCLHEPDSTGRTA